MIYRFNRAGRKSDELPPEEKQIIVDELRSPSSSDARTIPSISMHEEYT